MVKHLIKTNKKRRNGKGFNKRCEDLQMALLVPSHGHTVYEGATVLHEK
jgi:hypothetical protein